MTDDSERAICLTHALLEGKGKLDLKFICKSYDKWMKSEPFDVPPTVRDSFERLDYDEDFNVFYPMNCGERGATAKDSQCN